MHVEDKLGIQNASKRESQNGLSRRVWLQQAGWITVASAFPQLARAAAFRGLRLDTARQARADRARDAGSGSGDRSADAPLLAASRPGPVPSLRRSRSRTKHSTLRAA